MVTISEASREAWNRFLSARDEKTKWNELCDLMNLLEIASSILNEKSFAGVSKNLLRDYLNEVLSLLFENDYATKSINKMFSSPSTFENIHKFNDARLCKSSRQNR
jgi:hypothetical protein